MRKADFTSQIKKEIFEQSDVVKKIVENGLLFDCLESQKAVFGNFTLVNRYHFIACATSKFAGDYGAGLFNKLGFKATSHFSSEFNLEEYVCDENDAYIFLSQSGSTADSLRVLKRLKYVKKAYSLGIVNVPASDIDRLTDYSIYMNAGDETGVASTRSFMAQLVNIAILAITGSNIRNNLKNIDSHYFFNELKNIPALIDVMLQDVEDIQKVADWLSGYKNIYFLGRKLNVCIAAEGALKFKEISCLHAEACPAGEMEHGPIALIDEDFVCVFVIPEDSTFNYMLTIINEVKSRGGKVVVVTSNTSHDFSEIDHVIRVPKIYEILSPLINVVPLQLLAYFVALKLGKNYDKPRNLAK